MKRTDIKRRPLSDTVLAKLEPELKTYRELDSNGLYLRVKPNGYKLWELRYKRSDGKWSWIGLGRYPEVSGARAREKAAQLRNEQSHGKDPLALKREAQQAQRDEQAQRTFKALAMEWFNTRRTGWAERTAKNVLSMLERHVFPKLGQLPYAGITPADWMELFKDMEQQGILEQMRRVRACCKEIYDLGRVTGRISHNPVEGLHKFLLSHTKQNFSHVALDELPALLRAIRAYPHAHDVRLGLCLLTNIACRPSELREANWSEFDLEQQLWTVPAERMKKRREHLVPLSSQVVALLLELRTISGAYPHLFPGRNDRSKTRCDMVFSMALRRLGYAKRQTAHGFRHIASTLLNEHGFDENHIEAQLSHVKQGVAGVYNKAKYLEQRRAMMQWYSDHLDQLAHGSNVIHGRFGKPVGAA